MWFRLGALCVVAAAMLRAAGARAGDYNEFVSGDLSNVPSAPTFWPLDTGPNLLVAQSSSVDPDLVRIHVPANHTLDTITIESHDSLIQVFSGIQHGVEWTAGLGAAFDPLLSLGWMRFPVDPNVHNGDDILADMGRGDWAMGFLPPLASGDYTMLLQTSAAAVPYALEFNVRPRGDFDFNARVDNADLAVWADSLGVEGSTEGDADLDGDNDGHDFLIWQQNYGRAPPTPATATPEPQGAALAAVALAALASRRRALRCRSANAAP